MARVSLTDVGASGASSPAGIPAADADTIGRITELVKEVRGTLQLFGQLRSAQGFMQSAAREAGRPGAPRTETTTPPALPPGQGQGGPSGLDLIATLLKARGLEGATVGQFLNAIKDERLLALLGVIKSATGR